MIRAENIQVGDTFDEYGGNGSIEVVGIKG